MYINTSSLTPETRQLIMLFASVVAENANRRTRLSFPTPPHVPAPSEPAPESNPESIGELTRFPSWMENTNDPFGPDAFIPTLHVPGISTNSAESAVPSSTSNPVSAPRSQGAAVARSKTSVSDANAIVTTNAMGRYTSGRFSTGNGKIQEPISRKRRPTSANGASVAFSVALFEGRFGTISRKSCAKKPRRGSDTFVGLAMYEIPQTPFDPFGDVDEFPAMYAGSDTSKAGSSSGSHTQESDPVVTNTKAAEEQMADGEVTEDEEEDGQFQTDDGSVSIEAEVEGRNASEYSDPLVTALPIVKLKDTGVGMGAAPLRSPWRRSRTLLGSLAAIRMPLFHHSVIDLRHRSPTMPGRATRSDPGVSRTSSPTSSETDSWHSSGSNYTEDSYDEIEVHMANAAQNGQAGQAPLVSSEHASPMLENGPPNGLLFHADTASQNGRPQPSRDASISFRKAVVGRIRKLVHKKKGSSG